MAIHPDSSPSSSPGAALPARLNDSEAPADRLAEAAARVMWSEDSASRGLGMELLEVRAGQATLRMPIRADMTNGHGICHGGFMFLLADSTFAFACNSHNQRTVAAGAEVHFLAPARAADVLTARGHQVHRGGRSGMVAVFRGRAATIAGQLVESAQ